MNRGNTKSHMDGLFALLTFGVFAVCVLLVLLTGGRTYRDLTQRDRAAGDRRLGVEYVAAKVRHGDSAGNVFVGEFSGGAAARGDTLFLRQEVDGESYDTRIYWYDGAVRELFTHAGGIFDPADGQEIMPAESLCFALEGGLLSVDYVDGNGSAASLILTLRSGEGAA